jgi:hypothetical protein
LNQLSASVRATAEKARISGLFIERVEVTNKSEFEALNTIPDIVSRLNQLVGPDATELFCAFCGVDENGAEVVKSGSRVSFRRKLERYKWRMVDERLLRDAIGRDIEVEITTEDVAQLRGLMRQFDDLVDSIKARSAKLVSAVNPAEIEHRKMIGDRNRRFGGNGRQR